MMMMMMMMIIIIIIHAVQFLWLGPNSAGVKQWTFMLEVIGLRLARHTACPL
jgi:hypothetical protein